MKCMAEFDHTSVCTSTIKRTPQNDVLTHSEGDLVPMRITLLVLARSDLYLTQGNTGKYTHLHTNTCGVKKSQGRRGKNSLTGNNNTRAE